MSKATKLAEELMTAHIGHADEGPSAFSEASLELSRLDAVNTELLEELIDLRHAIKSRGVLSTVTALSKTDKAIAKATGGAA